MGTNATNVQMVWGPGTFGYSPSDLELFRKSYDVPGTPNVHYDTEHHGTPGGDNFGEGSLDTEYISGVGNGVYTLVSKYCPKLLPHFHSNSICFSAQTPLLLQKKDLVLEQLYWILLQRFHLAQATCPKCCQCLSARSHPTPASSCVTRSLRVSQTRNAWNFCRHSVRYISCVLFTVLTTVLRRSACSCLMTKWSELIQHFA